MFAYLFTHPLLTATVLALSLLALAPWRSIGGWLARRAPEA